MAEPLETELGQLLQRQRVQALRAVVGEVDQDVREALVSIGQLAERDLISEVEALAVEAQRAESFTQELLLEIGADAPDAVRRAITDARDSSETAADPFTWFLAASGILYLFSLRWNVRGKHFDIAAPGIDRKAVAKLLAKLFDRVPPAQ
jgi:hypothetical protein